jgi:uncharacterized protein (TIGR03085 family)
VSYSRQERLALCALLDEAGPDAPTLCTGWTTGDLAAHLVLRERRLDAAAGMLGGPLAGHAARTQQKLRARTTFPDLVQAIRTGPPKRSMMGWPGMDERLNTVEYFVHHEDIRRATGGWQPRELPGDESDELWHRLGMARALLRKAPVGVELARDDIEPGNGTILRRTARKATPVVTVIGSPPELLLWATGRTNAANVRFDGTEPAVASLTGSRWGLGG